MINITLKRYGEAGWTFVLTDDNPYARGIRGTFRTDGDGTGLYELFADDPIIPEHRVAYGDQFKLPADRRKAYARLRYLHTR